MKEEEKTTFINKLKKSLNFISVDGGFLGLTITIFILILTVKSELIEQSWIIATQLVLAIPFWMAALVSQAKIVDKKSFKKYYLANAFISGIALAFTYNTLGLLIMKYVFHSTGLMFFGIFLIYEFYSLFTHLDYESRSSFIRDLMIIIIPIVGGVLPALGIIPYYGGQENLISNLI